MHSHFLPYEFNLLSVLVARFSFLLVTLLSYFNYSFAHSGFYLSSVCHDTDFAHSHHLFLLYYFSTLLLPAPQTMEYSKNFSSSFKTTYLTKFQSRERLSKVSVPRKKRHRNLKERKLTNFVSFILIF